ncbi:MAG: hypothetical protein ACTSVI_04415 [Promethearchaeota archaeon]
MAKLRKSVQRQKSRKKSRASAQQKTRNLPIRREEFVSRDIECYKSSKKAYFFAFISLIIAIWMNGDYPPFNMLQEVNNILDGVLNGIAAIALFLFLVLAWGNALEIDGEALEWKHIIICLIMVTFISAWGGLISIFISILGAFSILTYLWQVNK